MQIWVDYIDAHNERNLDKIAEINSEDWVGYPPNGNVIRGNEAHIKFLDEWFKSPANPRWTVKWMIANKGEDDEGVMQEFLTTGNDITFIDEEGCCLRCDTRILKGHFRRKSVLLQPRQQLLAVGSDDRQLWIVSMAVHKTGGDQMLAKVMNWHATGLSDNRICRPEGANHSTFDPNSAIRLKAGRQIGAYNKRVVCEGQGLALQNNALSHRISAKVQTEKRRSGAWPNRRISIYLGREPSTPST